jgi:hypothetical protein
MIRRTFAAAAVVASLVGCQPTTPLPAPPTGVSALAVAPVENATGDDLVVAGEWYVERLVGRRRRTVPDVVADAARATLAERGFAVVVAGSEAPVLRVTLRRVDPDLPQLAWVSMSVAATLAAPDGTVVWSTDRPRWLFSTTGSPSLAAAYDTAARAMVAALLHDWRPSAPSR